MNVFIILLMAILSAGYYFIGSQGNNNQMASDFELKSILSCLVRSHIETSGNKNSDLPCETKYEIKNTNLCTDGRKILQDCTANKNILFYYTITTKDLLNQDEGGKVLSIIKTDYPYNANLGIVNIDESNASYLLSATNTKSEISRIVSSSLKLKNNTLVYITEYTIRPTQDKAVQNKAPQIKCQTDEIPIFRQNAWSCGTKNIKTICSGDYIWDIDTSACIIDNSKKPLCPGNTSAVMINDLWECVAAQQQKICPKGQILEMNYDGLEWECVPDPNAKIIAQKKCSKVYDEFYGGDGKTLSGSLISCNDCEKMIIHDDCTAECVPDAAAVSKRSCYKESCANFYFGFPDTKYIANAIENIPALNNFAIPLDNDHSKNRKFNCIECPSGINSVASFPPYVIVCN